MISSSTPVDAEYVVSENIIDGAKINEWLLDRTKAGVEAGVESVTEEILSNVGKAILNSYSPQLGDLLFGSEGDDLDQHTERILDRIEDLESNISDDHQELLDEVMDQYSATLNAVFRSASDDVDNWLKSDDLFIRLRTSGDVCDARTALNEVRLRIDEYIRAEGLSADIQFRRLNVLPLHITAAQLAVTAGQYCDGNTAIDIAFTRQFGTDYSRFDAWIQNLSATEIDAIEASYPKYIEARNDIHHQVLDFYTEIASKGYIEAYIDANFTPVVFQMARFIRNPSQYDEPEVVTSEASWEVEPGPITILDGLRWYYYMDIPRSECPEGFAFHDLTLTANVPWLEVAGQPAASPGNRFWILDPNLQFPSRPPSPYYIASFDGYGLWYEDQNVIYDLHRRLLLGDLVRVIYGPASLVLDRMYMEQNDGELRPNNPWDEILDEYNQLVGLLGVTNSISTGDTLSIEDGLITQSFTEGITYEEVLIAENELATIYGVTIESVGLGSWFNALFVAVIDGDSDEVLYTIGGPDGIGRKPWGVAAHGDYIYAGSTGDQQVAVIKTQTDEVVATLKPSGAFKPGVPAVNPRNDWVHFPDGQGGRVVMFDGPTIIDEQSAVIPPAAFTPFEIAVADVQNSYNFVTLRDALQPEFFKFATFDTGSTSPTYPNILLPNSSETGSPHVIGLPLAQQMIGTYGEFAFEDDLGEVAACNSSQQGGTYTIDWNGNVSLGPLPAKVVGNPVFTGDSLPWRNPFEIALNPKNGKVYVTDRCWREFDQGGQPGGGAVLIFDTVSTPPSEITPTPTAEPTPEPTYEPTTEPTAEPTAEPTYEPTTEPTVAVVTGQVILAGRAGNDWSGATVAIADGAQTALTDSLGGFTIVDVASGQYPFITADAPGYLSARCETPTVTAPETMLTSVTLVSGDIDCDDQVDITDATAIGVSFGMSGPDLAADINRDQEIDIFDLILVSVNFGKEGPQLWICQAQ